MKLRATHMKYGNDKRATQTIEYYFFIIEETKKKNKNYACPIMTLDIGRRLKNKNKIKKKHLFASSFVSFTCPAGYSLCNFIQLVIKIAQQILEMSVKITDCIA